MVKLPGCNIAAIISMVKAYVTGVTVDSDEESELTLLLPQGSSRHFPMLFTEIKRQQAHLMIASYGVSVTTMDEVFIRCGRWSTRLCPSLRQVLPSSDSMTFVLFRTSLP